jgi:APA family basic amino acid/polyamine antiporter
MRDLPRQLGMVDATAIVVGIVIGSGIFVLPNVIARNVPSYGGIIGAWVIGGLLSFFGALAYAELGAMLPATGGQYVYLREAYGPLVAFVCGAFMLAVLAGAVRGWRWFSIYAGFCALTPGAEGARGRVDCGAGGGELRGVKEGVGAQFRV